MYRINISLMRINNIILVLHTRIILSPSFVIYFFSFCHLGSFPITYEGNNANPILYVMTVHYPLCDDVHCNTLNVSHRNNENSCITIKISPNRFTTKTLVVSTQDPVAHL